jgi:hypothetical protein
MRKISFIGAGRIRDGFRVENSQLKDFAGVLEVPRIDKVYYLEVNRLAGFAQSKILVVLWLSNASFE